MGDYTVHLRYYAGDPLVEIRREDLDTISSAHGVEVLFQKIENRTLGDGMMREETLGKPIEEISQDVITIKTEDESRLNGAIRALYEKYRSPRTPYSFWGSSKDGERIAKKIADETGGGW